MPNPKQKRTGPARSASSMIRSSGCERGLRTVRDLARMWEGLMPSSVITSQQSGLRRAEQ